MTPAMGIEMARSARDPSWRRQIAPAAVTVLVSIMNNVAPVFPAGIAVHNLERVVSAKKIL